MKTLIITNSFDITTDILVSNIGHENIFRLNFDLLSEYSIFINSDNILLKSPSKAINENQITKVYWRKPFNLNNNNVDYEFIERKLVVKQIFNILFEQGKAILVNPNREFSLGKILQLRIAKKFFNVPDWEMLLNHNSNFTNCVTKSLSSTIIDNNKVIYTTKVKTSELDYSECWHLQKYIEKDKDLTIVFINGDLFAFELESNNSNADWRKDQVSNPKSWKTHKLNKRFCKTVISFMKELKLSYGRLDFVISDNNYYFLEVNINGQWAFLDSENKYGLLSKMINCIHPSTETQFLLNS